MTLVQTELKKLYIWDTPIKRVTMRPNGTEKQIRPVWRKPWANTILYLPLESDVKDYSPNNRWTFSNSWTLGTKWWVNCWYCGTSWYISLWTWAYSYLKPSTNKATYSFWAYLDWYNSYNGRFFEFAVQNQIYMSFCRNGNSWQFRCVTLDSWWDKAVNLDTQIGTQQWVYITLVVENSNWYVYKNWTLIWTVTSMKNNWFGSWGRSYQQWCNIAGNRSATSSSDNESLNWWISQFIVEDKPWTAQEVANYYNQTKWNYWIQALNNNLNNNLSNTLTPTVIPNTPNSWSWDVLTI
jgi:hypothetical protein